MGADEGKTGGAFISSRLRNPEAEIAVMRSKPDIVGGVFAIVATILMLMTAIVTYLNWDALGIQR
ncbi:MAG: hypothetical protein FWH21_03420 [Kiritimatiellaeota bacterium]|nr:hypothetical protein [Kiritimatiellota bacterium]